MFFCLFSISEVIARETYGLFEKIDDKQKQTLSLLSSVNKKEIQDASVLTYGPLTIFRFENEENCKGEVCKALIIDNRLMKELAILLLADVSVHYDYIDDGYIDLTFCFSDGRGQSSIRYDGNLITIKQVLQK